ncbi:uncharacterized protein N7506_007145 [Penicillium brevicompactum]|uniref:uncharacterized protein n=1 Tax=Penicillium brevicompactum TaxID=5074 RepID=UPI002540AC2E|nr:uncharacterized protein N7506_007145 [Penicillium brevicompactum]KAJ5333362.1 hypothetical protein N7506_007145 [Penicillium brevicompactum]
MAMKQNGLSREAQQSVSGMPNLRGQCDLSQPTCRQCARAGSRCDGYRDQHSLEYQDQTAETLGRNRPFSDDGLPIQSICNTRALSCNLSHETMNRQPQEPLSHDPWMKVKVSPEQHGLHFFFHHYLVNVAGQASSHPDCLATLYARAREPGYLANLASAVGSASLAHQQNASTLIRAASQSYSNAIRDIRVALADHAEAASDQMLVAVMLLALYETVTLNFDNDLNSWDRHVNGALALVQLRGVSQLRNRIGRSIFLNLRTEILINSLQHRVQVPLRLVHWMVEARHYETAQEPPAARLAIIIVQACRVLALVKEDMMNQAKLPQLISNLLSVDDDFVGWSESLPAEYGCETVTSPDHSILAYLGRYDIYSSADIAHSWNLQRCARIVIRQALVEAITMHLQAPSPVTSSASLPASHRDVLRMFDTEIYENASHICYSVPYVLRSYGKPIKPGTLRAAYTVHLLWPLYIAGTAYTATDALREWVIARMEMIEEATGIQRARLMATHVQQRVSPSYVA